MLKHLLEKLLDRVDLAEHEATTILHALIAPETTDTHRAAILTALRTKGESAIEIAAFARALRSAAINPDLPRDLPIIDIVGTGGDSSGSLNISTAASILTASLTTGLARVAKSGNRAISSNSGAADVLSALGLPMPLTPDLARECLNRTNFTFLFAPHYHAATAAVAPVRKALGFRTIFNILGPLTNPAHPTHGVIGAYSQHAAQLMAAALATLPIGRFYVVHTPRGTDFQPVSSTSTGWDEATTAAPFILHTVTPNTLHTQTLDPRTLPLSPCVPADLRGGDAQTNAAIITRILSNQPHPARSTIVLNAALALHSANLAPSLHHACELADAAITDGRAATTLRSLASFNTQAHP